MPMLEATSEDSLVAMVPPPTPPVPVPQGWEEDIDAKGMLFYRNEHLGLSSWRRPGQAWAHPTSSSSSASLASIAGGKGKAKGKGGKKKKGGKGGTERRPYFFAGGQRSSVMPMWDSAERPRAWDLDELKAEQVMRAMARAREQALADAGAAGITSVGAAVSPELAERARMEVAAQAAAATVQAQQHQQGGGGGLARRAKAGGGARGSAALAGRGGGRRSSFAAHGLSSVDTSGKYWSFTPPSPERKAIQRLRGGGGGGGGGRSPARQQQQASPHTPQAAGTEAVGARKMWDGRLLSAEERAAEALSPSRIRHWCRSQWVAQGGGPSLDTLRCAVGGAQGCPMCRGEPPSSRDNHKNSRFWACSC
jgi:hypothetical protein